jgi:hypothetical protein
VFASIREPLSFSRLESSRSVLVADAGGGFDVFAGLPLALALVAAGKRDDYGRRTFTGLMLPRYVPSPICP